MCVSGWGSLLKMFLKIIFLLWVKVTHLFRNTFVKTDEKHFYNPAPLCWNLGQRLLKQYSDKWNVACSQTKSASLCNFFLSRRPRGLRSLKSHSLHCAVYLLSGGFLFKHLNPPSHIASETTVESWHLVFYDYPLNILLVFQHSGQSAPIRLLQQWSG